MKKPTFVSTSAYGRMAKQEKEMQKHIEALEQELAESKTALVFIQEAKSDLEGK